MAAPYAIPTTISDSVLATTLADYRPTMVDNIYNCNVVLKMLNERKIIVDGGASVVQPIMTDKQNAGGFYEGADVLNNTQPNVTNLVEYKWQNAYEPIVITRDEERSNSGSEHKIVSLLATKMKSAELSLADRLEQALSTPVAEAGNLIDLQTLVGTGTLGTLNGATTTAWQSTVTASGSFATQGLTDMTTATYAVSCSAERDNPTVYLTSKAAFMKFEQTRLPLERFVNGSLSANAGFKSLTFKGAPVVYGNYIDPGVMLGLNMNYIQFYVDSATDFITTDFVTPVNQTVRVAYVLWRGILATDNRRRHFKLTGIS